LVNLRVAADEDGIRIFRSDEGHSSGEYRYIAAAVHAHQKLVERFVGALALPPRICLREPDDIVEWCPGARSCLFLALARRP
jgi:hypothetical protein